MSAHFSANIRRASSLFPLSVRTHPPLLLPPSLGRESGHRLTILSLYHNVEILPTKLLLCILTGFDNKALCFIFFLRHSTTRGASVWCQACGRPSSPRVASTLATNTYRSQTSRISVSGPPDGTCVFMCEDWLRPW